MFCFSISPAFLQVSGIILCLLVVCYISGKLLEKPVSDSKKEKEINPFGPVFMHETKLTGQRHCSHRCQACHYERYAPYSKKKGL